ncbi:hypothetical protein CAEBREN_17534 [Caenorhabditis brenneri]|uniref:Ubiquitin-like protease family profile domain-containing protein n=1 Tax=Caenorhabditis brenneri TaxID=135651 RepID=G0P180_CAEBE|nr:hypothetical protein CAEBREN_17534 [Caenorhabditis brenneri]
MEQILFERRERAAALARKSLPENVEVQEPKVPKRRYSKKSTKNATAEQPSEDTSPMNSSVEPSSKKSKVSKPVDSVADAEVEQLARNTAEAVHPSENAETDDKNHEMAIVEVSDEGQAKSEKAAPLKEDGELQVVEKKPSDKRLQSISIEYRDRKYMMPPLFETDRNDHNEGRTLLNDTIIEFYMCNYMWYDVYGEAERGRFHVFHTFFYSKLRIRFGPYYRDGVPRRSELAEHYNRHFQRVQPRSILQKEVLVIPIHLEKPKHWFLVLVHNPTGAIRHSTPIDRNEKSMKERSLTSQVNDFAQFERAGECRIIIMDSLFTNKKFRVQLDNAYAHAFDYIRLWLQMAAAADGEEMMSSRVRKVVCENLPQQNNSVDCGSYMMNYAEYFTKWNTEWITKPTDELAYLTMPEENAKALETSEPRDRIDKLLEGMKTEDAPININA